MNDGQKEIVMLAVCLSFFFVSGIFADSAVGIVGMIVSPMVPWMIK